jgi:Ni,Fe-hydrogenase maturation factor
MKVYCFGNEFLENDSLAKELADEIDGFEFVKCSDPSEIFLEEEQIVILDVVDEIKDVILIEDVDQLKDNQIVRLHDFDLSFFLKLMKEMEQIKKVKIIGIPMKGDKESIRKKVTRLLNQI